MNANPHAFDDDDVEDGVAAVTAQAAAGAPAARTGR